MLPKLQVIFNSSHKVNNIYKKFNELGMKSKMIIQVHDEIVCEVPNEEVYFHSFNCSVGSRKRNH
jgi:hypothetical protein